MYAMNILKLFLILAVSNYFLRSFLGQVFSTEKEKLVSLPCIMGGVVYCVQRFCQFQNENTVVATIVEEINSNRSAEDGLNIKIPLTITCWDSL